MRARELEERIEILLEGHFGWILKDYQIPIEFMDKSFMGQMCYEKGSITYYDETGKECKSRVIPDKIALNRDIVMENTDYVINNLILHELCHWVVHEVHGHVKAHGKEFKAMGRKIGLPDNFNRAASIVENGNIKTNKKYHTGKCSVCGKIVATYKRKSTVMKRCTDNYRSGCCKADIIYNGVKYY